MTPPRPGARLGAFGSLYLAVLWLAAVPLVWLWLFPGSAPASPGEAAARYLLAQRIGPLLLAIGEGARAASAMIALATGDPRARIVAHAGVVATTACVGLAVVPGPWLGLLVLAALIVRHAAAGFTLSEWPSVAAAVAVLGFGIAAQAGERTAVLVGFTALATVTAAAELFHMRRRLQPSS